MTHPTIYALIRATRERNQFTPTEVARRAGVERANYIRLEQGVYDCRWSTIVKVCRVLGIDALNIPRIG